VQAWAAAVTHPALAGFYLQGFEGLRGTLVAAIERGRRDGHVDPAVEPDGAARAVIGLLQGLVLQLVVDTGADANAYGEVCVRMLERYVRPSRGA